MTDQKPFKIKLHPLMDEKTLNAISDATLAAIGDRLIVSKLHLTPADIGKKIKGEGIYLGTYTPVDRDGVSLKKVFNVFAAPEDLFIEEKKPASFLQKIFKTTTTRRTETFTYEDTVKHVAALRNWHGHNGENYAADKELYAALKDGTYNGRWIIPTCDILYGKDLNGKETMSDNIFSLIQKDSTFKSTFKMTAPTGCFYPKWSWSSTKSRGASDRVCNIRLPDGDSKFGFENDYLSSCRPVRLVEKLL